MATTDKHRFAPIHTGDHRQRGEQVEFGVAIAVSTKLREVTTQPLTVISKVLRQGEWPTVLLSTT